MRRSEATEGRKRQPGAARAALAPAEPLKLSVRDWLPCLPPPRRAQLEAVMLQRKERLLAQLGDWARQGHAWAQVLSRPNALSTHVGRSHPGAGVWHLAQHERLEFSPVFDHGANGEIRLAHRRATTWVLRTVYFDESEPTATGRVHPLEAEAFARGLRALEASGSPLWPREFFSPGGGALSYLLPAYETDGDQLMRTLHATRPPWPAHERRALIFAAGRDVLRRLVPLHAHRMVHFDIKPANLLVARSGFELSDFDLAKPAGTEPGDGYLGGTYVYQAPETLAGLLGKRGVAPASAPSADLFGLGRVLLDFALDAPLVYLYQSTLPEPAQVERAIDELTEGINAVRAWMVAGRPKEAGAEPSPTTATWLARARQLDEALTCAGCDLVFSLLSVTPADRPSASVALARVEGLLARPETCTDGRARRGSQARGAHRGEAAAPPPGASLASAALDGVLTKMASLRRGVPNPRERAARELQRLLGPAAKGRPAQGDAHDASSLAPPAAA